MIKGIKRKLEEMSLEEKIGQMIGASEADIDVLKHLVRMNHIGFIYLPRKLTWTRTPIQVLNLTNQLQRLSRIPIIFCADLEHGLSQ
ncbi:hypothetical protein J7K43_07325, partial [Candidatus Calescamantes bacterium]|nr:hypothetical protein [Candidatus Calescamantes bacterium]